MEALYIRPEGKGKAYRVWPISDGVPPGAVEEGVEHILEMTDSDWARTAEFLVEGVRLPALRSLDDRTARWAWAPAFNVGRVEATLLVGGRTVNLSLETDAAVRKLARDEFDTMVREILEDTLALLAIGGHRKSFAAGAGRPPPLARLEYLRSRAEAISDAVRAIDARPRRSLVGEDVVVPYWRAHGATGTEIIRSMRGRIVYDTNVPSILPQPLRGMLPAAIRKRARASSLDIPEHRAIKACLIQWSSWIGAIADAVAATTSAEDVEDRRGAWAARLRTAGRNLAKLLELPLFDGVGGAAPRLEATPLFRHDPEYRILHKLAREMELATTNIFGDFLDLPLARSYDLYELWAFLRLARAAADLEGADLDLSDLFVSTPGGIEIAAGAASVRCGSLTVWFQRSFKEFWRVPERIGSMSREMVPDIVLSIEGKSKVIVLDAKYRVGTALGDAVSSAHMYRDAVVAENDDGKTEDLVAGSFLLSPYHPRLGNDWRSTPMPERLFDPRYRTEFAFGCFTLRPGMTAPEIASVLSEALSSLERANG